MPTGPPPRDEIVAAVALESTVISHGLPYPHNLRLALRLEEIVREAGAEPATVGVIAGEIVGALSRQQSEHLATAPVSAWVTNIEARRHRSVLTGRGCPPIMPFERWFHDISRQHCQCAGSRTDLPETAAHFPGYIPSG
ncbi:MAG: pseudouridine-5'-phosphate glycosidase [Chloroflexi bacterium]|nr:pseudouridine-5'-phosphate glycosidase [Chloroflexota bacterium]